ncbi:MAG: DUF167 domain-containing protein [Solirubrobacterales bacterium]
MGKLAIRVQARSRREEIAGSRAGRLLVRVKAPPVDGRANESARRLLAKRLGVPAGRVRILAGSSSRDKLVEVEGVEAAELRRRLLGQDQEAG